VLRGVFGTGEREGGRYVTGIAGCLHVVLGGLGKGGKRRVGSAEGWKGFRSRRGREGEGNY